MNDIDDNDDEDGIASLPKQTLRRIDHAFDSAIEESLLEDERPRKRRRVAGEQDALAGGFLLDGDGDDNEDGGGFVTESNVNEDIPLSLVPRALQLLDLDPSDQQVLSVFANAASSWSGQVGIPKPTLHLSEDDEENEDDDRDDASRKFVSRRDWRAVCAALIPTDGLLGNEESRSTSPLTDLESDSGSSDVVQTADLEEEERESSEDEYLPDTNRKGGVQHNGTSSKPKTKSKNSRKTTGPDSEASGGARPLTARQKQDTLAAFALFFPVTSRNEDDLSTRRLTIRELANAAASIKERITAEEIIEMLSFFSTSSTPSNPSLTLEEFQQLMVTARLA